MPSTLRNNKFQKVSANIGGAGALRAAGAGLEDPLDPDCAARGWRRTYADFAATSRLLADVPPAFHS